MEWKPAATPKRNARKFFISLEAPLKERLHIVFNATNFGAIGGHCLSDDVVTAQETLERLGFAHIDPPGLRAIGITADICPELRLVLF